MTALHTLSADPLALLRDADQALFALSGDSHYPLYHLLRVTCQKLAHVDSFYIGFFCPGEAAMVFPYSYDGEEYDAPEKAPYAPDGITAWILEHQHPYWSAQDSGRLLHRGRNFGDTARRSAETVVVPLLRPAGLRTERVMGLLGGRILPIRACKRGRRARRPGSSGNRGRCAPTPCSRTACPSTRCCASWRWIGRRSARPRVGRTSLCATWPC